MNSFTYELTTAWNERGIRARIEYSQAMKFPAFFTAEYVEDAKKRFYQATAEVERWNNQ
jgi:hypothetical protein